MNDPMQRFRKLVAIEATGLWPAWDAQLAELAECVLFFGDTPETSADIAERIGDADGVLLSYTRGGDEGSETCSCGESSTRRA